MIVKNILRVDPVFPSALDTYLYTIEVVEPTWPILKNCYDLLQDFMLKFHDWPSLNMGLCKRLFFLSQQPDRRERDALHHILVTYYDIRPSDRHEFIRTLGSRLVFIQEEIYTPLAAVPLLMCVTHVITHESQRYRIPLLDLLQVGVLPLLDSQYLPIFGPALALTLTNGYLQGSPELSWMILEAIQKHWPKTSGVKQVCFADLLLSVLLRIPQTDFLAIHKDLFPFLAQLALSTNAIVITIVFSIFDRPAWCRLLKLVGFQAVEPLYDALCVNQKHWMATIRAKSAQLLESIAKDYPLEFEEKAAVRRQSLMADSAMLWNDIIRCAGPEFDRHQIRRELSEMLLSPTPPTSFMRDPRARPGLTLETPRKGEPSILAPRPLSGRSLSSARFGSGK
jgi:hypothetical protein